LVNFGGISMIEGVGKDAPTIVNEKGGKQSSMPYSFSSLDPLSMFAMTKVLKEGRNKYGDDENWRNIPVEEHLNHAMMHIMAYRAGDTSDEHLAHLMCRAMFACAVYITDMKNHNTEIFDPRD